MKGTFDDVIAQLLELCLVNTNWSWVVRNPPKQLAQFQAMQANQHYATHANVFGLQIWGESLELDPYYDQEMQELEYWNNFTPMGGELAGDVVV